ncbi:MAG TPA: polysaccharide deacetylase family protein, partial [Solirubrobacteraceae bacterium]|nr:polysaccharide deacetylase family protein [Solirubrobacteraceae bacterium]
MRADVIVLCYHAVSDRWRSSLAVTPPRLEAQVRSLLRRGYRPQTFTEAVREPAARRVVVVTFDDAYRSVISRAAPVLERLGVPGTVFAPTGFVGSGEPMSWPGIEEWLATEHREELVPMDWEELRALAARGWEVGSHTVRHPHLTSLDATALDRELRESRAACEGEMG